MGQRGGFIQWQRVVPARRAIAERTLDWREVEADHAHDGGGAIREQAGRCMDCGVPFCHHGCPLGNPIPEFADLVWRDRWAEAHRRLAATNEFPELTGRLCPAPCEASCVLAIPARDGAAALASGAPAWSSAVTIEALERAIADRAFAEGWVVPRPPTHRTGKRVAIVGSGPAGLAAAARLNRAGHTAIVYEAAPRAGGLLRYGIPDFKLEKHVIDRRLAVLAAEGVELRCGVTIGAGGGAAPSWRELRDAHDAVIIAIGAARPRDLDVPGRDLDGVTLAMDFLCEQNRVVGGELPAAAATTSVAGKHVVILGGGDTGSDCLGTALRHGAASVQQIEIAAQPPAERAATNPWPAWPLVFRTSSSQEEGGTRQFAFRTTRLEGRRERDGERSRLVALHGERLETGEPVRIAADALVLALGFTGPDARAITAQLGVELDPRGNIATDRAFATSVPGVFCVGDAHRGASLIVWAIAEGRDAATAVSAYLASGSAPSRY